MCVIYLKNNQGKSWQEFLYGTVKGFAFYEGVILDEKMLYEKTLSHIKRKKLNLFLKELNGNFSIVIKYQDALFLIVDKFRSYPLFYSVKSELIVSDIGVDMMKKMGNEFNEYAIYELLALGYLSGTDTLAKNVYSVEAGSYVTIELENRTICKICYFSHIYSKETLLEKDLFQKASLALENGFKRMLETIKERPVLLPLSGGYDSRLIACLCKKFEIKNVTCFTYGRSNSFEVSASKRVAEALGFKWYYIEYTDQLFDRFINDVLNDYFLFAGNIAAIPHFQDLPALMELKRQGILTADMIVIPGHSGDLLGGSKIPPVVLEGRKLKYNAKFVSELIFDNFYDLNELSKRLQQIIKDKNRLAIKEFSLNTEDDLLDIYEGHWFVKAKVANFLVNSMRGYEFMDMDWRLPLWDDEYAKVWYSVPWVQKHRSVLYDKFMFKYYFECYGVDFSKSANLTTTSFSNKLKRLLPNCVVDKLKIFLTYLRKNIIDEDINSFNRMLMKVFDQKMINGLNEVKLSDRRNINAIAAYIYIYCLKHRIF